MTTEMLQQMSDLDLCKHQAGLKERAYGDFLAQAEWRRRDKLVQQELNQKIIERQHELNLLVADIQRKNTFKISLLVALIGIIGVFVGAFLKQN